MKRIAALCLFLGVILVLLTAACTPPPERQAGEAENGIEETNGEATETPAEGEAVEEDGKGPEEGAAVEEVPEVPEEEPVTEEEEMLTPEPIPENMFDHYQTWPPERITQSEIEQLRGVRVVFETTKGTIKIRLFPDEAPLHSANCVKLVQDGFYDGLTFHRVIRNFMSQGGDPEGTGSGGPGYTLPAEIGLPHVAGSMAAARQGDQVNPERRSSGSQFYLCHSDQSCAGLNGAYTVYGQIVEGQDVNLALNVTWTQMGPIEGAEPDRIIRAYIEAE